jgi:hypothetical protein
MIEYVLYVIRSMLYTTHTVVADFREISAIQYGTLGKSPSPTVVGDGERGCVGGVVREHWHWPLRCSNGSYPAPGKDRGAATPGS